MFSWFFIWLSGFTRCDECGHPMGCGDDCDACLYFQAW
jgi:hypothetical protein